MKSSSDIESRRLEKRLKERFVKAMATYHLIEDDDRILVGLTLADRTLSKACED